MSSTEASIGVGVEYTLNLFCVELVGFHVRFMRGVRGLCKVGNVLVYMLKQLPTLFCGIPDVYDTALRVPKYRKKQVLFSGTWTLRAVVIAGIRDHNIGPLQQGLVGWFHLKVSVFRSLRP